MQGVGATQLKGGVGQAGDVYERHADRVAAEVVAGESAEPLLDLTPGGTSSPATETDNTPVQMTGNSPPKLGVSRKYNPISREMTAANDRGVDLSNPRNRREFRTAGDIVGPLPGPVGHREFFLYYQFARQESSWCYDRDSCRAGFIKTRRGG